MMLHDRVNIVNKATPSIMVREDVPAQVGNTATSATVDKGVVYIERAQVVLPGSAPFHPDEHAIIHDGRTYTANGDVLRRYRRGKLHHITVPVQRITA